MQFSFTPSKNVQSVLNQVGDIAKTSATILVSVFALTFAVRGGYLLACRSADGLANLGKDERDALLAHLPLRRLTANTLTSARALRGECESIAELGYALDREEFITGLIALAVPVRDAAGQVRAAIAVHAPVARMSLDQATARLQAFKETARRMARLL